MQRHILAQSNVNTRKLSAFTLIELLVVIAIIAVLASILFPVFAQAKEAAKKAACISNLKQCSIAFIMYAEDYDGTLPQRIDYPDLTIGLWYAHIIPTPSFVYEVDFSKGQIQPYMKNFAILDCNAANSLPAVYWYNPATPPLAYGVPMTMEYNLNLSEVEGAAETILLADAATYTYLGPGVYSLQRSASLSVGYTMPESLHGRHPGDAAVIGWADGHVKAQKLSFISFEAYPWAASAETIRQQKLGYAFKYPPVTTAQNYNYLMCTPIHYINTDSCNDFYYYLPQKPAAP